MQSLKVIGKLSAFTACPHLPGQNIENIYLNVYKGENFSPWVGVGRGVRREGRGARRGLGGQRGWHRGAESIVRVVVFDHHNGLLTIVSPLYFNITSGLCLNVYWSFSCCNADAVDVMGEYSSEFAGGGGCYNKLFWAKFSKIRILRLRSARKNCSFSMFLDKIHLKLGIFLLNEPFSSFVLSFSNNLANVPENHHFCSSAN